MVQYGMIYDMKWFGLDGMVLYGMVRYGKIWCGMI